jgi:hypothetical protein
MSILWLRYSTFRRLSYPDLGMPDVWQSHPQVSPSVIAGNAAADL